MLRTAVLTIATAVNYSVAMAITALVLHVATGGVLPAQATAGLVVAAGGLYALCTASVLERDERTAEPVLARVTPIRPAPRTAPPSTGGAGLVQPAMAFAATPTSKSA